MGNNGSKEGVAQMERREFSIVSRGLDREQVNAFVEELTRQRDEALRARDSLLSEHEVLLSREQHLASLQKLAEKTVVEADKLATEIKQEAERQAREMAEAIRNEAEHQAHARAEEIMAKANVRARLVYDRVFSQLKTLKQQVIDLDVEFEEKPPASVAGEKPSNLVAAAPSLTSVPEDQPKAIQEKEIEIDILPPVDAVKITKIMDYLERQPEIEVVELIPRPNKPCIIVFEKKPVELAEVLKKLAVIGSVKECRTAVEAGKPERRRLEVSLAA